MLFKILIFIFFVISTLLLASAITPKFRILAPEFICPKDEDAPIEKPDNTIITLQTPAGATFDILWTVRWTPLKAPSQRLTLLLWKTVRALENKLNSPQVEPYVYVIPNNELIHGVNYEFNISAVESGEVSPPKSFHIDNTQGDSKLNMVEGRSDLMHVVLIGAQIAYADAEHILEAQVMSCFPTQDYYFIWTVRSVQSEDTVDVSATRGARLVIPPNSLTVGLQYDANCQVIKQSTGLRITQTGLPFQVLKRGLEVYLSVDYLVVPANYPFAIDTRILNNDYYNSFPEFQWECTFKETPCKDFENTYNDTLLFPAGLSSLGEYKIKLTVNIQDETAEASATIETVEHTLPVIQINPIPRTLNEDSEVTLVANVSNVAPTCTLTWYFATTEFLNGGVQINETCNGCEHGEPLSDTLTIFSLEENFLTELTDFTNETEWRQVSGEMAAKAGRARFVAMCGCSITFECTTMGTVYADLIFELNVSPKTRGVKIVPPSGSALETMFRISTLAALDQNTPLRYSFYCRIGDNDALLLGSLVEFLAVETFLPYIDGGTDVWVEVCDSLGACSVGEPTTVVLVPGDGSTAEMVIENIKGHSRRCEINDLRRDATAAIITYTNAGQTELLSKITTELLTALPDPTCTADSEQYTTFLHWLATQGVNTNNNTTESP